MKITLVQSELFWHDAVRNRAQFEAKLLPLANTTDLIVLPEMFTTGFTMAAEEVAEAPEGPTVQWMQRLSSQLGAVMTGSVVIKDRGQFYNRLIWMRPDGTFETYDKRHLFRLAREQDHYSAGTRRLIVELNGWKICPLICYDLRFPVWSRNRREQTYDCLIYVANWPARRSHAWQTLLKARAIENLSYAVGVNRVGSDAAGYEHTGDSAAIDFLGQALTPASQSEFVTTVALDRNALCAFREKFAAHLDSDDFELQ